ncbi:hybrid sensor histidine kinase/response regulator [Isosphaeraceae bacterium EP7]
MTQAILIVGDRAGHSRLVDLLQPPDFQASCSDAGGPIACESLPSLIILSTQAHPACEIRAIRACRSIEGVPILALWNPADAADVESILDAGADDLIDPDTHPALLRCRVGHLARGHQLHLSNRRDAQMASAGRLLAGIVHELRGPLASILAHAEYLRLTGEADVFLLSEIEPIIRAADLMRGRLEHLMAGACTGPGRPIPLDAAPLLREVVDFFRKNPNRNLRRWTVELTIDDSLPRVEADPGRLLQVVFHLLINAMEAVSNQPTDGTIRVHAWSDPETFAIEVADNGPGIQPGHVARIFEPSFTTKPDARGYGLYLAAEFARELGGRIDATNQPDGGARFRLQLPRAGPVA